MTSMLITAESQLKCKEMCKNILKLDPKIRFAGLINDKGRYLTGATRKGVKFLISVRDKEMLFTEVALRTRMRREFDQQLGKVDFSLSHRKNVIILSFPYGEEILYV
ncbi:MAG: DUF6659 family protein, partial [Nitrosopumilaceae archaeon]